MCSPVEMNELAIYEGSGFQELYQVHDIVNFGQSIERAQLFKEIMRLYLVHGRVHNSTVAIRNYRVNDTLAEHCLGSFEDDLDDFIRCSEQWCMVYRKGSNRRFHAFSHELLRFRVDHPIFLRD
jgi:hypothetical protein